MKEKCSKCYSWKDRKDFIPLSSGAKPKCIACVQKQGKVEDLKKKIDSTSALLFQLKEQLQVLTAIHIEKAKEVNLADNTPKKTITNVLRMHPKLPIGMKKGDNKVYYFQNGAVKEKQIWQGQWGPYTSYKDPKSGQWKYIGLDKLKEQIFGNDSKLGV
jgi:hypothetical protein